jgi:hypothetical protein
MGAVSGTQGESEERDVGHARRLGREWKSGKEKEKIRNATIVSD